MKLPPVPRIPVIVARRNHSLPVVEHHPLAGPAVDVVDDGRAWRLVFEVPGSVPDRLSLEVLGRVVTLRGERRPTDCESGQFLRIERVSGPFERSLELPEEPDPEATTASYADGLLTVEIPRRSRSRSRSIPIRRGGAPKD